MLWNLYLDYSLGDLPLRESARPCLQRLTDAWSHGRSSPPDAWVLIHTCYRSELIADGPQASLAVTLRILRDSLPTPPGSLTRPEAIFQRLALLTAGVLSPTLGEPQIAHQVKTAYASSRDHLNPVLHRLFTSAFHCAKRIRTETGIQRGHLSLPGVVCDLIREAPSPTDSPRIFLLGTGEIARAVAAALGKQGYRRFTVASRTLSRAREFRRDTGAEKALAWDFNDVPRYLREHHVLISATAAPYYMWTHEVVARHVSPSHPRLMIDLAVPRDIEPSIGDLPGVHLVTVDDIQRRVSRFRHQKEATIRAAEVIAAAAAERFSAWLRGQALGETIRRLLEETEAIRREMVEVRFNGNRNLVLDRAELNEFTRRLTKKVLNSALQVIKSRAGG